MEQTISWSKNIFLKWSDFMADPNPAAFEDASSTVRYRATWTILSEKIDNQIKFFIKDIHLIVEFLPLLSWVREMYATPKLLKHEQGHFDLAELLRNQITTKITDTVCNQTYSVKGKNEEERKQFAKEHSALLINAELEKWKNYLDLQRSKYDKETNYGEDDKIQSKFDVQFLQLRS